MADDLSRIVGKLEAMQEALEGRLDRQDEQHAQDKAEAIRARDERHNENQVAIKNLDVKLTETHRIATENQNWITVHGVPMAEEWAKSKERKKIAAAEFRGRAMTWAKIGGASTILITGIGYLGRDAVAAVLRKVASLLG